MVAHLAVLQPWGTSTFNRGKTHPVADLPMLRALPAGLLERIVCMAVADLPALLASVWRLLLQAVLRQVAVLAGAVRLLCQAAGRLVAVLAREES